MKRLICLVLLVASFSSFGKTKTIVCENSHASGSKIKLEFIGLNNAMATVVKNGASTKQLLEVISKSRTGVFFKTESGNILKLVAAEKVIELSQIANAFDVNFQSANCHI